MASLFKVDTKGTCLLCLSSSGLVCGDDERDQDCSTAFKGILRYLKVDETKLLLPWSSSAPSVSGLSMNLSVSLCEKCSSAADIFLELFQAYERIGLELNACVRQLHESMENGSNDEDRVREYENRMETGQLVDLVNTEVVKSLRKEVMDKASRKVLSSIQMVSSPDVVVKEEVLDEEFHTPALELELELLHGEDIDSQTEQRLDKELAVEDNAPFVLLAVDEEDSMDVDLVSPEVICSVSRNPLKRKNRQVNEGGASQSKKNSILGIGKENEIGKDSEPEPGQEEGKEGNEHLASIQEVENIEVVNGEPLSNGLVPGKSSATLWKCDYCGNHFSKKGGLQTHQLNMHTVPYLLDNQLLHSSSSISEKQLDTAIENILGDANVPNVNCPFCGKGGFRKKSKAKPHLLRKHLNQVLEEAGKVDPVGTAAAEAVESTVEKDVEKEDTVEPKSSIKILKCGPCGKYFSHRGSFRSHQLSKHKTPSSSVSTIAPENSAAGSQEPGPSSQATASSLCKCDYCGKCFSQKCSLQTHQLSKHTKAYLVDNNLIPSSISEHQLDTALSSILELVQYPFFECPLCPQDGFQAQGHVKLHLLRQHLNLIIEEAGRVEPIQVPEASSSSANKAKKQPGRTRPRSKPMKCWTCAPCGKEFFHKGNFQNHQLSKHMMTVLKDLLPPSISKEIALTAVRKMATRWKILSKDSCNISYECPFCEKKVWNSMKLHLLQSHLDQVIGEVEKNQEQENSSTTLACGVVKTEEMECETNLDPN